jgi:hypothetical protein
MSKKPILVVLDIDGTLMAHGLRLRPGAEALVAFCLEHFAWVAIWTAACDARIDELLCALRRRWTRGDFLFTWSRRHIVTTPLMEFKPLRKVWRQSAFRALGISRHNTLIVDDCPEVCARNRGNHLCVPSYSAEMRATDAVLNQVLAFLRDELRSDTDVRRQNIRL